MNTINLLIGIHNHQPLGNWDSVFEHAYRSCYRPFLDILEKHPHVKLAQHYTGILCEWLMEHHPELFQQLRGLVQNGQVEMMTGGFYEPILSVIPDEDKIGQIRKLTAFVEQQLSYHPVGMWLAERIWEQHITKPIAEAGVKYVVIDDTHFRYAGLREEQLLGYYVTEEQGETVNVFPISKTLRYTVPFQPVQKTIEFLRSIATEDGSRIVVCADDGEKFGAWPKTYLHVFEDGWLDDFFTVLEENRDWIRILHFSEALEAMNPVGRIYLPDASYAEMMHWSLPSAESYRAYEEFEYRLKEARLFESYEQFVRGGFWRNFMVKYPESNNIHKKMLRVSERARRLQREGKDVVSALDKVWAGQCNCPYWHGVFGGLYLTNLRSPVYRSLIAAEKELDEIEERRGIQCEMTDFDCDGKDELIVESRKLNVYINPNEGGSIFELDFKPISFNLLDVLSRREEGYHSRLHQLGMHEEARKAVSVHDTVKEKGLERYLDFDWYRRASLLDHFLGEGTTLDDFAGCKYPEQGDFVNRPYDVKTVLNNRTLLVSLERRGGVWTGSERHRIRIMKTISLEQDSSDLLIGYTIENLENEPISLWFGIEFNYGLLAGDAEDRYYVFDDTSVEDRRLRSKGIVEQTKRASIVDEWLGIRITLALERTAAFWRFPIETVSISEGGFERVYQSSVLLPNWKIQLEKSWTTSVVQSIEKIA